MKCHLSSRESVFLSKVFPLAAKTNSRFRMVNLEPAGEVGGFIFSPAHTHTS